MNLTLYSVTSLNRYIKQKFDSDISLKGLKLKGEISNFKPYSNGHIYFTLKDENSSIKAVMFSEYTKYIKGPIKDGDEIVAVGFVSTYPARGEYQFYCQEIELAGLGQQLLELEMLKKKLAAEGLFDQSRKREIKLYPRAIGVICAPNSAALSDIEKNIRLRNPFVELKIFPSLVQGSEAPKSLLKALKDAENTDIDTLIIGRGGGASEDLSAFNDESLVRAVANFPVPVIAAVGHEIDFTLIDYVADARASTPTGAAVLSTIDMHEVMQRVDATASRLDEAMKNKITLLRHKLDSLINRPFFINPQSMYKTTLVEVENIKKRLDQAVTYLIQSRKDRLKMYEKQLQSLSIDSVLSRGFAMMQTSDGEVITSVSQINIDQELKTQLKDGCITTKVIKKEK